MRLGSHEINEYEICNEVLKGAEYSPLENKKIPSLKFRDESYCSLI